MIPSLSFVVANNQDALDAIVDIKEAITEYGSDILLVTLTEGAYDPYRGATTIREEVITKALITNTTSNESLAKAVDTYELSIKVYSDVEITEDNLINFRGNDYKIMPKGLDSKILQNETLLYELLVKK